MRKAILTLLCGLCMAPGLFGQDAQYSQCGSAARYRDEWQTIASAPEDGTPIDILIDHPDVDMMLGSFTWSNTYCVKENKPRGRILNHGDGSYHFVSQSDCAQVIDITTPCAYWRPVPRQTLTPSR